VPVRPLEIERYASRSGRAVLGRLGAIQQEFKTEVQEQLASWEGAAWFGPTGAWINVNCGHVMSRFKKVRLFAFLWTFFYFKNCSLIVSH